MTGFESAGTTTATPAPWPSAFFWGCAPGRQQPIFGDPAEPALVSIAGEDAGFQAVLSERLTKAGHSVTLVQSLDLSAARGVDRLSGSDDEKRQVILFLAEEPSDADAIEELSEQVAALARIATLAAERDAVLWVITRDAQQATLPRRTLGPAGGALWGLGRMLVNEMPRLCVRLLDLPGVAAPGERAELVAAELAAGTAESEIVWTPHGRHVLRLRRGLPTRWAMASDTLSVRSKSRCTPQASIFATSCGRWGYCPRRL